MTLGEKIKAIREVRGMTQEELALAIGYTDRSSIAKVESDKVDLQHSKIKAVAAALRVDPAELLLVDDFHIEMKELDAVTAADKSILDAYRAADEKTRRAVRALLEVEE